jgi:hypothetical protein
MCRPGRMAHVLSAGEERTVESSFIPPRRANLEGSMHHLHNEMECSLSPVHISFRFVPTVLWHGLKSESLNGIKYGNFLARNRIPQMCSGGSLNYFRSREAVPIYRLFLFFLFENAKTDGSKMETGQGRHGFSCSIFSPTSRTCCPTPSMGSPLRWAWGRTSVTFIHPWPPRSEPCALRPPVPLQFTIETAHDVFCKCTLLLKISIIQEGMQLLFMLCIIKFAPLNCILLMNFALWLVVMLDIWSLIRAKHRSVVGFLCPSPSFSYNSE